MQLTASKPALYAFSVCRCARMLRRMHRGLAAADLWLVRPMQHLGLRAVVFGAAVASLCACGRSERPRDGSDFSRAIIVNVPPPMQEGWEMRQIAKRHPDVDFTWVESGSATHGGRRYHVHALRSKRGEEISMVFDMVRGSSTDSPN